MILYLLTVLGHPVYGDISIRRPAKKNSTNTGRQRKPANGTKRCMHYFVCRYTGWLIKIKRCTLTATNTRSTLKSQNYIIIIIANLQLTRLSTEAAELRTAGKTARKKFTQINEAKKQHNWTGQYRK